MVPKSRYIDFISSFEDDKYRILYEDWSR